MVIAAFVFGIVIFSVSLVFLLNYIRTNQFMRETNNFWARQQRLQLKLQADLQARMEADERKFEEMRRALLKRAGGDSGRSDVGHAA